MPKSLSIIISVLVLCTLCKWLFSTNYYNDSQFSILERADKDVVLLHSHVFMAVWGNDLVAQKQETVERSDEVAARVGG